MTLVDTSVWVEHLRRGKTELRNLMEDGEVLCHPFMIGELACGWIANRTQIPRLWAKDRALKKAAERFG